MDRVHQHLEPRHALQERPVAPRRVQVEPHLDVGDVAEQAARQRVAQRQHVRREAQLEVDGGDELPLAAEVADALRVVEVAAHRLLDEHRGAGRQAFEDAGDCRAAERRRRTRRPACRPRHRATRRRAAMPKACARSRLAAGLTSKMPATGKPSRAYTGRCASRTMLPAPMTTIGRGAAGSGHAGGGRRTARDWCRRRLAGIRLSLAGCFECGGDAAVPIAST